LGIDHLDKTQPNVLRNGPDIVIREGTLLSSAREGTMTGKVDILIGGSRIVDITPARAYPTEGDAEIIDARNCIVMPGLINSHAHSAMTLFRGYADDLPLRQWLYDRIFPAEAEIVNAESVYWGTMLACLEMIGSGTTGVIESYFFADSAARAFHESGLRAVIAQGVIDYPAPGVKDPGRNLSVAKEFIEKWLHTSELITPGLFCHSPITCSDRTLTRAMGISKDFALPMQTHLSETLEEVEEIIKRTGQRPVPYLDELGIIDRDLIAAHAIHLDTREIATLSERGAGAVHVPESNMKLSSGVAKVPEMISMGVNVGIGTDGCASNNNLDLFKEMDTAAKLGKVYTGDPVNMSAETVLEMATSGGAKLMGLAEDIGRMEKGKKADIIVIDMNSPHLVPVYNPVSTLVYSANGADTKDVIVNGRILMKDRQFKTLDQDKILQKVREISVKIRDLMP
jgi:5-methylthioadenosine/S-adenosylhomocysteine deaminase